MPTVLITGANRGIGLEFARQYAADGWNVIASVRESSPELEALGVRIERLDMRDLEAVASFGARVEDLDLLVANAGTWLPEQAETAHDGRAWAEMMVSNSIGPYLLAHSVLPKLRAPGGKLVALSSGLGSIGESTGGYVPYRSSKAALNMAWHALAIEVKPRGLIAITVDPGWVKTRMGGKNAPTTAAQSVSEMRQLIERLTPEQSGGFLKRDGARHAW
ncbi:SDR family oxidoreductase [Sphingomonas sinipercae]|uniref:SDR family oxidoreductase n=1 Tax=Sphingomonas sinipercae TaxID=2714944 RepID=A0A6G7ZKR5_9SPHN|nr:SDR family oxidoreductase [Sphingomonas sinipercae]QIL01522.1 SDR family oxidoreductase [Sphingomonas sinipercae]